MDKERDTEKTDNEILVHYFLFGGVSSNFVLNNTLKIKRYQFTISLMSISVFLKGTTNGSGFGVCLLSPSCTRYSLTPDSLRYKSVYRNPSSRSVSFVLGRTSWSGVLSFVSANVVGKLQYPS